MTVARGKADVVMANVNDDRDKDYLSRSFVTWKTHRIKQAKIALPVIAP